MTSRFARTGVLTAAAVAALGIAGTAAPAVASSGGSDAATDVSGSITVLTNRTDIVDTVFADYADQFNQIYPDVDVKFEAITDYEGEVRIRMNTEDYGDVLLIPNDVTADQLPTSSCRSARSMTSARPTGSSPSRRTTARRTASPRPATPMASCTTSRLGGGGRDRRADHARGVRRRPPADRRQHRRRPLYTNYAAGWPLTQWEGNRGSISNDPDEVNALAHTDAPWAEGTDHYVIDSLLYDAVAAGLIEADPTTTDWEWSKGMLGHGEIATMALGSWAIVQMQEQADNPDDIGYMPFPHQVDGTFYSTAAGDYKVAINKHSDNVDAARAWLDWFVDESGYAESPAASRRASTGSSRRSWPTSTSSG